MPVVNTARASEIVGTEITGAGVAGAGLRAGDLYWVAS